MKDPGKEDKYLFECNKDWQMINFFGGKQELMDKGSFEKTILRELEEELEISRKIVKIVPLYDEPSSSYSITGAAGILTKYSGMLFQAFFSKELLLKNKDKLITISEIKAKKTYEGSEFMIASNHYNKMMEIDLENLPYSYEISNKVIKETKDLPPKKKTIKQKVVENKDFIAAILTFLATILGLYNCS